VAGPPRLAHPSSAAASATSPADEGPRLIAVRVKPRSAQDALEQQPDGSWVARLRAPPVDGRANEALIALVAAHFGISTLDATAAKAIALPAPNSPGSFECRAPPHEDIFVYNLPIHSGAREPATDPATAPTLPPNNRNAERILSFLRLDS
jgi:hypothetical protein